MEKPKSIMIPLFLLNDWQDLTDQEFGNVIRAGFRYALDGIIECEAPMLYFRQLQRIIDDDAKKYAQKCEQNRANIRKRWGSAAGYTTEYDGIQSDSTGYDGVRPDTTNTHININNQYQDPYQDPLLFQSSSSITSPAGEVDGLIDGLKKQGYSEMEIQNVLSRIPSASKIKNLPAYIRKSIEKERQNPTQSIQPENPFLDALEKAGLTNDDAGNSDPDGGD